MQRVPEGVALTVHAAPDGLIIAPGAVLGGKYRVVRSVGRGGMAQVYEAIQLGIGKRVAVKVLNAQYAGSPILTERFFREARAASAVKSLYIVDVYDSGRLEDQRPFIVMELLEGETLYERLSRERTLRPEYMLSIVGDCCKGLAKAHAAGIVHRDLKPENIFVVEQEDGKEVTKLLDFGLAKFYSPTDDDESVQRLTRDGAVFGTPPYMSPEQVRGQAGVDHRTDLWALGCVVYEILVGHPVWKTDQGVAMIFSAIAGGDVPHPSSENHDLPLSFDRWFRKALARKSDERFQSSLDFMDALREAFSQVGIDRARVDDVAEAATRRMASLRPPAMGVPPPPPLIVPVAATQGPINGDGGLPVGVRELLPTAPRMMPLAQPRRARWAKVSLGVLTSGLAGVAVGIAISTSSAVDAPSRDDESRGRVDAGVLTAPVTSFEARLSAPVLPPSVREFVAHKRFLEATQELAKSPSSAPSRWLAEAWRRVLPGDAQACAPTAWAAIAGDPIAITSGTNRRVFFFGGSKGSPHVFSLSVDAAGWLTDAPAVDATPEGTAVVTMRIVPVGDRFALFLLERGEDEKTVRLRVRTLGENGEPLGTSIVVQTVKAYRHLSEVQLSDDGYVLAYSTLSGTGAESMQALRLDRAFQPRGKPTMLAQGTGRGASLFGAPHVGRLGKDTLFAYVVTHPEGRFAETQLLTAEALQWGTEVLPGAPDARLLRRLKPGSRVAERVAPGAEIDLACTAQRCFLGWEDDIRGTYVARLDSISGSLHVATSLGKGIGRVWLVPGATASDSVQVVSHHGAAFRSTIVDALGAHPGGVLVRSLGTFAGAAAGPSGLGLFLSENDGPQRHGLMVTTSCP